MQDPLLTYATTSCRKANAVDVEDFGEYKDMVKKLWTGLVTKVSVMVDLNDVKEAQKQVRTAILLQVSVLYSQYNTYLQSSNTASLDDSGSGEFGSSLSELFDLAITVCPFAWKFGLCWLI